MKFWLVLGGVLVADSAQADAWHHAIALPTTLEHDSNIRMSATDKRGVTRAILAPTYSLTGTYGVDEFKAALGLRIERSSDRMLSMNREAPNLLLGWRRFTETGEFSLTAKYDEASSQQTQLQETGLVVTDSTRINKSLGAKWQSAVTARSTLAASLDYLDVSFSGGTHGSPLNAYRNLATGLNWSYAWSETVEPFLAFLASHYEPEKNTVPSADNYSLQAGAKVRLAENWDWTAQAGTSHIVSRINDRGWIGSTSLRYTGLRQDFSLSAARSISPSADVGFVQSDQLRGNWGYAVDELTRLSIDASWQKSHGLQPNTMKQLGASASRDLSLFWTARFYYQHKLREQDGQPKATGDVLGLTLTYSHPDF